MSRRKGWRALSADPVSGTVRAYLRAALDGSLAGAVRSPDDFLKEFVEGREVLDIGIVEHDLGHMGSPDWKHAKIARWSRSCLGIDILEDELEVLRGRGYEVARMDATSRRFLGRRFERIVIGDVIEHVDDPVSLLRFARRHLRLSGRILVTTPNPYWVLFLWESLRTGTYVANADHVRWVSPTMALELARRADLRLDSYWQYQPTGRSRLGKRIFDGVRSRLIPRSELFTHSFYYVFSRQNGP